MFCPTGLAKFVDGKGPNILYESGRRKCKVDSGKPYPHP